MSDTPDTPISDWQLEPNVTCVVCPDCAFTFDAVHEDVPNGGHTCPLCEIDRLTALLAVRDATIAEQAELLGCYAGATAMIARRSSEAGR